MLIVVDQGHTLSGSDYGAKGNLVESNETRNIANEFKKMAEKLGHKVVLTNVDSATSVNNSLTKRVNIERQHNADWFVSIHLNAGGGRGTEVYIAPNSGGMYASTESYNVNKNMASKVSQAISSNLGLPNRGVKEDNFYVLVNTRARAMLVEACFVDSTDNKVYSAYKVAKGLCEAITGSKVVEDKPVTPTPPKGLYRVIVDGKQVGAYSSRTNAMNEVNKHSNFKEIKVTFS